MRADPWGPGPGPGTTSWVIDPDDPVVAGHVEAPSGEIMGVITRVEQAQRLARADAVLASDGVLLATRVIPRPDSLLEVVVEQVVHVVDCAHLGEDADLHGITKRDGISWALSGTAVQWCSTCLVG